MLNEDNYLEHSLFEHYHQGYPYGHSFVVVFVGFCVLQRTSKLLVQSIPQEV